MAQVLYVTSSLIGIFSFFNNLFSQPDPSKTTVRVAAGLSGSQLHQAGGSLSGVKAYNENQALIGSTGGGYIGSGGFHDFQVDQNNMQQAPYIELLSSNDAVCIPYISVTWADGSKYGWVGDWGRNCGLNWYHSNVYVSNSPHTPACTWIDGDHTNGIQAGAMLIHMPSFAGDQKHSNNASSYCGYPAFRAYRNENATGTIFKRDAPETRLVVSDNPFHSAIDLCKSSTSRGPDFVSTGEGVFCDMETRKIMPVCSDGIQKTCFNVDDYEHTYGQRLSRSEVRSTKKSYSDVIKWEY